MATDATPLPQAKWFLTSKTVLFNLASFAIYAAQAVGQANILSPEQQILVNIAGNTLFRFMTSQPVTLLPAAAGPQ